MCRKLKKVEKRYSNATWIFQYNIFAPIEILSELFDLNNKVVIFFECLNSIKTLLVYLLHSLAALVSSQPTSCFAHELPFTVANACRPTSFSIKALYTSIGGTPCKNFPLSVVRIYYETKFRVSFSRGSRRKLPFSWQTFQDQGFFPAYLPNVRLISISLTGDFGSIRLDCI